MEVDAFATIVVDDEKWNAEANMPAYPGKTMAMGTDKAAHAGIAKDIATNDTMTLKTVTQGDGKNERSTFVIDTDSYSGNFEREMTGWITGDDGYGECYTRGTHEQTREEHPELSDYFDTVRELMATYVFDSEYGDQICGIVETPGWSNNGMGKHTRLAEGETRKWPAYNSVGISLRDSEMPADVISTMKELAYEYAKRNKIVIEGFRILTIETVTTEESVAV